MLAFLGSTFGRLLLGGLASVLLIGGFILWHKYNFVSREQVRQWQEYSSNLRKAVEKQQELAEEYSEQKELDDKRIEELEKERERLLEEDRKRPDPVCLDPGDTERLRSFRK